VTGCMRPCRSSAVARGSVLGAVGLVGQAGGPTRRPMNAALQRCVASAMARAGTRVHRGARAPSTALLTALAADVSRSAASAVTL
jgi:hypothetical protein